MQQPRRKSQGQGGASRRVVKNALEIGGIVPGETTVIEKTGGNFGFGLALACAEIGVSVELVVGLSFSPVKRQCLEFFGAKLIGIDMLKKGAAPREVILRYLVNAESMGKRYFYTDQFNNIGSLEAHLEETGPELSRQLAVGFPHVKRLSFVACAGTGASLTGIARSLRASGFQIDVVLVEPEGCDSSTGKFCDHPFEGMSVGVSPPFLDWTHINQTQWVRFSDVVKTQRRISVERGFFVGNTSAACLHVAMQMRNHLAADHKVLTIVYDHGLWYLNTIFADPTLTLRAD
ncbi:pyridoxal-phosphate dependent enzyme [Roseateles koreensis]|uniref:Pyridoxal-phosphate dependent enzyme n=1 Tax=Roseateles koreensis TaxID=2987526 RepID=A0ABT5KSZ3_9BURK|nr:pyridoxal-phosphate dependent enzyme [Roseateles koreensis]MDC8786056.1 pyridoxal-phosphate dependent enzyme [Roseateles koreensis]